MSEFAGDLEGYLAWAEANYEPGPSWCARHWAPCPVEGLNGILMTMWLMQESLELMPDKIRGEPSSMNEWMAGLSKPICCLLGDKRMDELWQQVRELSERAERERRL